MNAASVAICNSTPNLYDIGWYINSSIDVTVTASNRASLPVGTVMRSNQMYSVNEKVTAHPGDKLNLSVTALWSASWPSFDGNSSTQSFDLTIEGECPGAAAPASGSRGQPVETARPVAVSTHEATPVLTCSPSPSVVPTKSPSKKSVSPNVTPRNAGEKTAGTEMTVYTTLIAIILVGSPVAYFVVSEVIKAWSLRRGKTEQ